MKFYVLNLTRAPERLATFRTINPECTYFNRKAAVDGKTINRADLVSQGLITADLDYTDGALGCALSHMMIWAEVLKNQEPATIVEDDAILREDFLAEQARILQQTSPDWEIIHWGFNTDAYITFDLMPNVSPFTGSLYQHAILQNLPQFRKARYQAQLLSLLRSHGTICYSISPLGAKHLLENVMPLRPMETFYPGLNRNKANTGIDDMMANQYERMKAYVCLPPIAIPENDVSRSSVQPQGAQANVSPPKKPIIYDIDCRNILMGGENGDSSEDFARKSKEILRPSTRIENSPHIKFLKEYESIGDDIFNEDVFVQTEYCKNAISCIQIYGSYFNHTTVSGVIERARRFIGMYKNEAPVDRVAPQETPVGQPIAVRKVFMSNCYELLDGHHRCAIAMMRGQTSLPCSIQDMAPALTPMQKQVLLSSWTDKEAILYQPIDLPEFGTWPVVRKCSDRLSMMLRYLETFPMKLETYADLGCSYGWFVSQMHKKGYRATGIDRDINATDVGCIVYNLNKENIIIDSVEGYSKNTTKKYDIVSCFSVLHHFVTGRSGTVSPESFIRDIDRMTNHVMFFDMGEEHEDWFKHSLKGWNAEFIKSWLLENTSFDTIEILGKDEDAVGNYANQYGRHLFACSRKNQKAS